MNYITPSYVRPKKQIQNTELLVRHCDLVTLLVITFHERMKIRFEK